MSWDKLIAKMALLGILPREVAKMTLYQAFAILQEVNDDTEFKIKLAGGDIPDKPKELTFQDLFGGL